MSEHTAENEGARRLRVVACRNHHSLLFGIGWPSVGGGDAERRVYIYLGPWLLTVTHTRVLPPAVTGRGWRP